MKSPTKTGGLIDHPTTPETTVRSLLPADESWGKPTRSTTQRCPRPGAAKQCNSQLCKIALNLSETIFDDVSRHMNPDMGAPTLLYHSRTKLELNPSTSAFRCTWED